MSGSGGGPIDFGGPRKDCKSVSSYAIITSPNQTVLSQLNLNDIITLSLQSTIGPILGHWQNNLLGSVLPTAITDIIECMNSGTEFQGRVVELNGAHCRILITAI